jgi:methylated-DNA-[protein]-cysteine S-methyltransferase
MFEYISQVYNLKGPSVTVEFSIQDSAIVDIKLQVNTKNYLEWQIKADRKESQIEKAINSWMKNYSEQKDSKLNLPLDFQKITPYTLLVLEQIGRIKFGKTFSYKDLAKLTGKPKAARAVGNACGKNPFALVIPCHRVLASDGSIGGYSGDPKVKEILLKYEGIEL